MTTPQSLRPLVRETRMEFSADPSILPPPPERADGPGVVARMLDALRFRLHHATAGLREQDFAFAPCEGSMTIGGLLEHVRFLAVMIRECVGGEAPDSSNPSASDPGDGPALVERIQRELASARAALAGLDDAALGERRATLRGTAYPVWHMIHGPLADALTHVGQINSWRRIAGNPPVKTNHFLGRPA